VAARLGKNRPPDEEPRPGDEPRLSRFPIVSVRAAHVSDGGEAVGQHPFADQLGTTGWDGRTFEIVGNAVCGSYVGSAAAFVLPC
jgi:hypothetical protein